MLGSLRPSCEAIDDNCCCVVESALQAQGLYLLAHLQFERHPLKSIVEAIGYIRMYVAVAIIETRAAGCFGNCHQTCVRWRQTSPVLVLLLVETLRRPALRGRLGQLDRDPYFFTPSFVSHSLVNALESTGLYARSPPSIPAY